MGSKGAFPFGAFVNQQGQFSPLQKHRPTVSALQAIPNSAGIKMVYPEPCEESTGGCLGFSLTNVDPGFIKPCLLIWGCSPPKVIPTKTRIGHPHIDKQGFIHPGSTLTFIYPGFDCGSGRSHPGSQPVAPAIAIRHPHGEPKISRIELWRKLVCIFLQL